MVTAFIFSVVCYGRYCFIFSTMTTRLMRVELRKAARQTIRKWLIILPRSASLLLQDWQDTFVSDRLRLHSLDCCIGGMYLIIH